MPLHLRLGFGSLYLPNNFSDTLRSNVLFDNAVAQLDLDGQLTNSSTGRTQNLTQGNLFAGNVCYATARREKALQFRPEYNYGTLTGNYFCNPFTDSVVSGYGTGNKYYTLFDYTLSQWRSLYTWADVAAKTDPIKRPAGMSASKSYGIGTIFINESPLQKSFVLGPGTWVDLDNRPVTGSLTLTPFTSQILVCSDTSVGATSVEAKNRGLSFMQLGSIVRYELFSTSSVALVVYDSRGRLILKSSHPFQERGRYSVDFARAIGGVGKIGQGIYTYVFSVKSSGKEWVRKGRVCVLR